VEKGTLGRTILGGTTGRGVHHVRGAEGGRKRWKKRRKGMNLHGRGRGGKFCAKNEETRASVEKTSDRKSPFPGQALTFGFGALAGLPKAWR